MDLQTYSFEAGAGWRSPPAPSLNSRSTLVLAFGAPDLADGAPALRDIQAAYPDSVVVGCSTAGEIHGAQILDDSLSVAVMRFDRTAVETAMVHVEDASESFDAGVRLAKVLHRADLRGVLVLSDGLKVNGTELVNGINSILDEGVVVTGGLAGDGSRFQRTWVLADGAVRSGTLTAVGFYGDHVRIGHGSKGGWDLFGPERLVTRSEGNVLYELDGRPALQLYKTYLGDRAAGLPATGLLFPLALRSDDDRDQKRLVRTILAVDEATQSLTFAGDIPTGARAQLMRANMERLVQGAADAADMTGHAADGSPVLSIAISCVGRRLVLGERTEEEVEATLDVLPATTRQVGFYSYGELSPFASGRCDLHNQTMTLTTISEA